MFHGAMWAGTDGLNLIIGLCSPRRAAGKSPFLHLAKQGMVLGVSSWLLLAWLEMGLMKGLGAVSSSRGLAPYWQQVEG